MKHIEPLFHVTSRHVGCQESATGGEDELKDTRPDDNLVRDLTAQPAIEDQEKTKKFQGTGMKQPCGRVVGIIRRRWREKQYCGTLRQEGDRAVTSGKGQTTSALFMPVDKKVWCLFNGSQRLFFLSE